MTDERGWEAEVDLNAPLDERVDETFTITPGEVHPNGGEFTVTGAIVHFGGGITLVLRTDIFGGNVVHIECYGTDGKVSVTQGEVNYSSLDPSEKTSHIRLVPKKP